MHRYVHRTISLIVLRNYIYISIFLLGFPIPVGVDWNCTGSSIASSYGRTDMSGWCDYAGAVCCWNIFGRNFNASEPDFVLDHPSCLMCVSWHPMVPSLVAAGSFNGEIVVWSIAEDKSAQPAALAVSAVTQYSHKEPVLNISWIYDTYMKKWLLSSCAGDGRLLFWDLDNNLAFPVRGCLLKPKGRASSSLKVVGLCERYVFYI